MNRGERSIAQRLLIYLINRLKFVQKIKDRCNGETPSIFLNSVALLINCVSNFDNLLSNKQIFLTKLATFIHILPTEPIF